MVPTYIYTIFYFIKFFLPKLYCRYLLIKKMFFWIIWWYVFLLHVYNAEPMPCPVLAAEDADEKSRIKLPASYQKGEFSEKYR